MAALAGYLHARAHGGEWLVRMEDVDTPRCVPGADALILRTLEQFGFEWDGPVLYQSTRTAAYQEAFERLQSLDAVYPSYKSRSGRGRSVPAWRLRESDVVVKRADGLFAYQLAVVVDDAAQGITHVVRGADLLDSTPGQIRLQQLLGYPTPRYVHVPVVTNAAGEKLSKQTHAPALDATDAPRVLREALEFLCSRPSAAFGVVELDGDEPRDAGLLHGDAIHRLRRFHRLLRVGDDDELRVDGHLG